MKYEFVEINASLYFNEASFVGPEGQSYRDVVNEMASKGWRFVSAVPVSQNGQGKILSLGLVFEREDEI